MSGAACLSGEVEEIGHRYWRVRGTAISWSTEDVGYRIMAKTLAFFNSTDGTGPDLCLGKTATASSTYFTNVASAANDNNEGTYWRTDIGLSTPAWWKIDAGIGQAIDVHSFKFSVFASGSNIRFPKTAVIEWSDDDSIWTSIGTINTAQSTLIQTFGNF